MRRTSDALQNIATAIQNIVTMQGEFNKLLSEALQIISQQRKQKDNSLKEFLAEAEQSIARLMTPTQLIPSVIPPAPTPPPQKVEVQILWMKDYTDVLDSSTTIGRRVRLESTISELANSGFVPAISTEDITVFVRHVPT